MESDTSLGSWPVASRLGSLQLISTHRKQEKAQENVCPSACCLYVKYLEYINLKEIWLSVISVEGKHIRIYPEAAKLQRSPLWIPFPG